jgi:hypothetical protein
MFLPVRLRALVVLVPLLAACGGSSDGSTGGTGGSSSTSGSTSPTSSGGSGNAYEDCVSTINDYRSTLGLPPYMRWTTNESCTDGQAQADAQSGTPHSAFGRCGESAQNECPGWPGPPDTMIPQCLALMWAEGPGTDFSTHGHYLNMSSTSYTQVACGFYVKPDMSVWATQDFK